MNPNRRVFLKIAGKATAVSLLLPAFACTSNTKSTSETETDTAKPGASALGEFGIQLYTLRDIIYEDPKGILKQLSEFGFTQIESYEGTEGMFWGMSNTEFKSYLDSLGMRIVSSHCSMGEGFEEKAKAAAEIGMKYLICPSVGAQKDMAAWDKIIEQFNECGAICRKYGIRFAYHNHAYSFDEMDGVIIQDYMMEKTNPLSVDFQLDLYWVVTAGADPIAYLNKYPNRFKLCHVKDRLKTASPEEHSASCTLGTGSINYPEILKIAQAQGMEYYILEQERYDGTTPIACAKAGAQYLKNISLS